MNALGDGYLRLTLDLVLSVRFAHLVSGLDHEHGGAARCGSCTTISGYTEWIGKFDFALTIGWDWAVDPSHDKSRWRRVGLPRTNVLLIDPSRRDYDWRWSLAVLGTVVDALPWQDEASSAIAVRYAT